MPEQISVKKILFELMMYSLNAFVFCVGTLIYVFWIRKGEGLPTVLDAFINEESPYWIFGIIFLYIPITRLIYWISTHSEKALFREMLRHISDYLYCSLSNIGSSLSGIMFALTVFLYRSSNSIENAMIGEALGLAISCFCIFFIGTVAFAWIINLNKREDK